MFINILFIVFVLLLINISLESNFFFIISNPFYAFWFGICAFLITLGIIFFQQRFRWFRRLQESQRLILVNIELILFLMLFHFLIGGDQWLLRLSYLSAWQTWRALYTLTFYFLGIGFYHYVNRETSISSQMRMMTPFVIPFIFLMLIFDLIHFFPGLMRSFSIYLSILIGTLIGIVIFFPYLLQKIWKCRNLPEGELKNRLKVVCERAKFKHAGFKIWTVMGHTYTAAIVGIIPSFRYVMFTEKLLKKFSFESIEAILAHEIGHSYRKHLMIYPFIIFGATVFISIISMIFYPSIEFFVILGSFVYPSVLWKISYPFMIYVPLILLICIYFRYVFGFFSRLFERQADLHVFQLKIPAKEMINALDALGKATGNSHFEPNWHHFSIKERMNFLSDCQQNPRHIQKFHHRVKRIVLCYFILLIAAFLIMISENFPNRPVFKQVNEGIVTLSNGIKNATTLYFRKHLGKVFAEKYNQSQNIADAFQTSFKTLSAGQIPGVAEYLAAKELMQKREWKTVTLFLTEVWEKGNLKHMPAEVMLLLRYQTELLTHKIQKNTSLKSQSEHLKKVSEAKYQEWNNAPS